MDPQDSSSRPIVPSGGQQPLGADAPTDDGSFGRPDEQSVVERLIALHAATNELSRCRTVDELCRQAIQLARERLTDDRYSIWLHGPDPEHLVGTFGVSESGEVRDERGNSTPLPPESASAAIRQHGLRWVLARNVELYDERRQSVGNGDRITAGLWDGENVVGYLFRDNLISRRAFTQLDCELQGLLATAIGHLLARARAYEALRQSEAQLRAVFANAAAGIALVSPEGRYLGVNARWAEMLGYPAEDLIGRPYVEFTHPDDRLRSLARMSSVVSGSSASYRAEKRYVRRDGSVFHATVSVSAIRESEEGVTAVVAVMADISDRVAAEEALRQSEERYRLVFENAPLGVMHFDSSGVINAVNANVARILGAPMPALIGFDMLRQLRDERMLEAVRKCLAEGSGSYEGEHRSVLTGKVTPIRVLFQRVLSEDGRVLGGVCIAEDLTEERRAAAERRRMEERIREAQRLESLAMLAGGVAHDFNNILTGVIGNASLAREHLPEGAPAREFVQRIELAARRASDIASQMLAYSGRGALTFQPTDVSRIVRDIVPLLEATLPHGIAFIYDLDPEVPLVRGDPTQIRQVVLNLVANASEAIGDKSGTVHLRVYSAHLASEALSSPYLDTDLPDGLYVVLEITDTGEGIAPEARPKLFDPFFTTKFMGRGLGLPAVLGIVRGHRGTVQVESESGRGATFRVMLPVSEARTAAEADPPDGPFLPTQAPAGAAILVADDDTEVRRVASEALELAGYQVIVARDGDEAVRLLREHIGEVAAVVLDDDMPRMGGEETVGAMLALRPNLPVILSSGYSEHRIANWRSGRPAVRCLQKPYTVTELLAAVADALGAPAT